MFIPFWNVVRPSRQGRSILRAGIAAACLSLFWSGAATAQTPIYDPVKADPEDWPATQQVCTACHASDRFTHARSWTEWKDIFQMMITRGAKGSDNQWDHVHDFFQQTLTTLNVNTAPLDEIAAILEIKEDVAEAIFRRRVNQKFTGIEDLSSVPGINQKRLQIMKDRLSFGDESEFDTDPVE